MTNQIAIIILLLIVGFIGADQFFYDGEHNLFLLKQFMELTEWLAFWR